MRAQFEFSNTSTGDLALVLLGYKIGDQPNYLKGLILARLLNTIVESRLIVTLVLDCCFSAAVYCNNTSEVRYFLYDLEATSYL